MRKSSWLANCKCNYKNIKRWQHIKYRLQLEVNQMPQLIQTIKPPV